MRTSQRTTTSSKRSRRSRRHSDQIANSTTVEQWALEFPDITDDYIRRRWDGIKNSSVGWDWLVARARVAGFSGDAQLDFADPPYDPKSFFEIDAKAIRSRMNELVILRAGWLPAYEEVRAELDKRSTITAAELDALISYRGAPDDTEPRAKRPKRLLLDQLGNLPEPSDFVEGILCDGQSSVIYGDTDVGKSFFALDLAMHVALGKVWPSSAGAWCMSRVKVA